MHANDRPPANAAGPSDPTLLPAALAGGALALGAIALGHAALVIDGLRAAFATVVPDPAADLPWWTRLQAFAWLAASVQAVSAGWGAWQAWRRRGTPGGAADLRAALWLVFAMHVAQGAGIGAIVPPDAPFQPTPLGGVIVSLVATLAATAWLRRANAVRTAYGLAFRPQGGPERHAADTAATAPLATNAPDATGDGDGDGDGGEAAALRSGRAGTNEPTDATDTADEAPWADAMAEVSDPARRSPGLWARCFAQADGDERRATAAYLRERVARDPRSRHRGPDRG